MKKIHRVKRVRVMVPLNNFPQFRKCIVLGLIKNICLKPLKRPWLLTHQQVFISVYLCGLFKNRGFVILVAVVVKLLYCTFTLL